MIRFDWGPTGAQAVAAGADVAVVVDVLSFTTTLTVATERGMTVWPFPWKDDRAAAYAAGLGATLAIGRFEARAAGEGTVSLSPAHLATVSGIDRLVLPSPNGSTISAALASTGATVVGACLLNRTAVAEWLLGTPTVAVVAAGERWPDGSLRPCAEDLWGAGAVIAALVDLGAGDLTPEARLAEAAFRAVAPDVATELAGSVSGRELVDAGFGPDVEAAGRVDVSSTVPVLDGAGAFRSG